MYPIPVLVERSYAVLPTEAVASLFGEGYGLRGTERAEVAALGRTVAVVDARPGPVLRLVLDAADRAAAPDGAPLRLVGPRGVLPLPTPAEPLCSRLVLPEGLLSAWRLTPGQHVAVAVGRAVLTGVPVAEGPAPCFQTDRAVLLAGEASPEAPAHWRPGVEAPTPPRPDREAPPAPAGVITENDVRQARRRRETLRVAPGQIVTPAARALGRELGVLDENPAREGTGDP
ncbi:MAG: hypothetical protein R3181_03445 [Rubricoccaceae bacterium]|nr:hypothetical protein [Rubricoccaceae bacterium]